MVSGNHNHRCRRCSSCPPPSSEDVAKLKRDRADLESEIAAEAEEDALCRSLEGNAAAVKLPSRPRRRDLA